ncbi:MAG: transcriptional regulator with only domain, AraC family, partial [Firmicutes bacterium]|nr:transcriptional regulator with only domain, AraC family [Bacillota bacterium]
MGNVQSLTNNKKWQALTLCRSEYDGVFFYGVRTTGVFCRPSCRSREPKRENVEFFDSARDAVSSGFRPCKRCRPDLIKYDPDDDMANRAMGILEIHYSDRDKLEEELKGLGVSRNHLVELFRRKFGVTPAKYISGLKVVKASELLSGTDISIIDIALLCGFRSLSAFYDLFRKEKG